MMKGSSLRKALEEGRHALGVQMVMPSNHVARIVAGVPGLTVSRLPESHKGCTYQTDSKASISQSILSTAAYPIWRCMGLFILSHHLVYRPW